MAAVNVALLYVCDGRTKYLQRCVESLQACCDWPWAHVVVSCDEPDPATLDKSVRLTGADVVVSTKERRGGAANIARAWRAIQHLGDVDFVFHVEEDFTFLAPVPVQGMLEAFVDDPWLAQMTLRRQPWGGEGPGGYIGDNPDLYDDHGGYLRHREGFWLNPTLYPVRVTFGGWPTNGHEHHFTKRLLDEGYSFGVWGERDDPPRVWHIGNERHPSWTW